MEFFTVQWIVPFCELINGNKNKSAETQKQRTINLQTWRSHSAGICALEQSAVILKVSYRLQRPISATS